MLNKALGPDVGPAGAPTPLILDFLEWLSGGPRPYAEVMDVWRTSCPRLTVWEDALDAGLVARRAGEVALTPKGRERLAGAGRP
ncbi:hypothetical protein [Phenylobacterium montanum]|uniref:hypothetical protein n=1 Tax=Phenylobacterium montanum TaxID=2823693 RepID=UPI0020137526|nr:hypothetical protein [Caulobacter sp. S6]